jgi:predicted CoA-binding protein
MADHDHYSDGHLRTVLGRVRTIAMVGASPDWHKASSFAMKYLQSKGYRVIPVNPRAAGRSILGETCYERLADIP